MKALLRAALALLLAAPALHHPRPAAGAPHPGARARDERLAAVPSHRVPAAEAPAPKRARPPAANGPVPQLFIPTTGLAPARDGASASTLRAPRVLSPRRINRPAYYATAPPRERR